MSTELPSFSHPGFKGIIGVAREDITPPVGIYARNWGAALTDVAEGVHRPLTASAITIQTNRDEEPLILVSLDLGWWRCSADEYYVRGALLSALGIVESRLLLHFTHTHASPSLCREDADKPGGQLIAPYLDFLIDTVNRAVKNALATSCPAVLEWSYGVCDLAKNRDLRDPSHPRFLTGFNDPAPANDTLLVGRVTATDGRCLATLVNYACHPTTLAWENRLLSPDFVSAMREEVEANTSAGICLFLQGASGELAPREQYVADTNIADAIGRQLGFAVLATLVGMLPAATVLNYTGTMESGAPLAIWRREPGQCNNTLSAVKIDVELELKSWPTAAELNTLIEADADRVTRERLVRKRRIREGIGDDTTTQMPVWIWNVGDAVMVAHSNEAYSLMQTELRNRFPGKAIVVMNVTNGHFGYLPPRELYDEDIYSVWQTPFAVGGLERTIEACAVVLSGCESVG